jgi:hypothetical protein
MFDLNSALRGLISLALAPTSDEKTLSNCLKILLLGIDFEKILKRFKEPHNKYAIEYNIIKKDTSTFNVKQAQIINRLNQNTLPLLIANKVPFELIQIDTCAGFWYHLYETSPPLKLTCDGRIISIQIRTSTTPNTTSKIKQDGMFTFGQTIEQSTMYYKLVFLFNSYEDMAFFNQNVNKVQKDFYDVYQLIAALLLNTTGSRGYSDPAYYTPYEPILLKNVCANLTAKQRVEHIVGEYLRQPTCANVEVRKSMHFILCGAPGTGKTSLARAIATKLQTKVVCLPTMGEISLRDFYNLLFSGRYDDKPTVFVVDDMNKKSFWWQLLATRDLAPTDTTTTLRLDNKNDSQVPKTIFMLGSQEQSKPIYKSADSAIGIGEFLSIMDGVVRTRDIFIITSNISKEEITSKFDLALLRPGRFEHVIQMDNLSREDSIHFVQEHGLDLDLVNNCEFPLEPYQLVRKCCF